MAVNRYDPYVRVSMWKAYDRRCPYCTRLVGYESFQLDHIISNEIQRDAKRLATLAEDLNLPIDFDYQGFENLIVSCRVCNRLKAGGPQQDADLRYTLGRAKGRTATIKTLYAEEIRQMAAPTAEQLAAEAQRKTLQTLNTSRD